MGGVLGEDFNDLVGCVIVIMVIKFINVVDDIKIWLYNSFSFILLLFCFRKWKVNIKRGIE